MEKLLQDLSVLQKIDRYLPEDIQTLAEQLETHDAKIYIQTISLGGKPEQAMSDYLFRPLLEGPENLNLTINPQIRGGNGWVDYLVRSDVKNPVAIELKPLLRMANGRLCRNDLEKDLRELAEKLPGQNQVIKYLRDYDSVAMTDMKDIFYFNREAIVDFKPFLKEDFLKFVEDLKTNRDVWDVIRRKEDRSIRHDLDRSFFADLKKWFAAYQGLAFKPPAQNEEETVRLLNKFVFLKTLEDHALIPFNYIRDTYEEKRRKWESKGRRRVFSEFFDEITRWSYEYYDTELFRDNTFDLLVQDDANLRILETATEKVLGLSLWDRTFGLGLIHYNYRSINEDIFGKAYETFLAEERKERGIFYTHHDITEYMSSGLVNALFLGLKDELLSLLDNGKYEDAEAIIGRIVSIKIIDLSCGSGSFLVKVFYHIWNIYCEINEKTIWATRNVTDQMFEPDHITILKNSVKKIREQLGIGVYEFDARRTVALCVLRHIYGADIDEKAIDVAKVNIWKEAIKIAAPHFRYTKLPQTINHVLPNLELNFVVLNSIVDLPIDESLEIISGTFKDELIRIASMRNAYLEHPFAPDLISEAGEIKQRIGKSLAERFCEKNALPCPVSFLVLEFFFCFFNEEGNALSDPGFDGIIGNPPWENIKPIAKEFAARHYEFFGNLTKFSIEGKDFEKKFSNTLEENSDLKNLWDTHCRAIQQLSSFVRENYKYHGSSGDLSYQKVFLERAANIVRQSGLTALLVPSGFHTDEGQKDLRKLLIGQYTLLELMSFENLSKKWFPDIDPREKFDAIMFKKAFNESERAIAARFYIHDIKEAAEPISVGVDAIRRFSPFTMGLVEFRNQQDVRIAGRIRAAHPLLQDRGYRLASEFHMTNDNKLFHKQAPEGNSSYVLYEGKMLHQYDHEYHEPRYWIDKEKGRKKLISKEMVRIKRFAKEAGIDNLPEWAEYGNDFMLDCDNFRLAYRAVASSTNERSLISTILPPNVFLGHSINYFRNVSYFVDGETITQEYMSCKDMLYMQALLNSFVLDYYIRLRVSANLTMFFLYELPVPKADMPMYERIIQVSIDLLPDDKIYNSLAQLAGVEKNRLNPEKKRSLRSKLESLIAEELFGLTKDEKRYILSTFVHGNIDRELIAMIADD